MLDSVNLRPRTLGSQKAIIEAFVNAGVQGINEHGVDNLSVSWLAKKTGVSRQSFYSHFGNISGLHAEIWLSHGNWFLKRLAEPEFNLLKAATEDQQRVLALLEIFTAARRIPEVSELVEPIVSNWWTELEGNSEFTKATKSWLIANRLGMWITLASDAEVTKASIVEEVLKLLGGEPRGLVKSDELSMPPEIPKPELRAKSKDGLLMEAAISVVANSGTSAATMNRVARQAQVTTGTIYPRFISQHDLLLETYAYASKQIVETNISFATKKGFAPEQFGAIVIGSLRKSRKLWRNFRIEMYLESQHNKKIAELLRKALRETNQRLEPAMGLLPVSNEEREGILYLTHTIGLGMTVLLNNGIAVDALDHVLATIEMVGVLTSKA